MVRAALRRRDVEIVAGVTVNPEKEGADLGSVTVGTPTGHILTRDLDSVLARSDVDAVLYAGLGKPEAMSAVLGRCADAGKDAVTIAGLVHPRTALGDAAATALHARARNGGARIVGTGINPGFLLDVLPVVWASLVPRVDRVGAVRVADIRRWGDQVLEDEIGIGRAPDRLFAPVALSLRESVALIADALGLELDRIEDRHEVLTAPTRRQHAGRLVDLDQTVGFRRVGRGHRRDAVVVELEWCGIFCLDPDVDGLSETAAVAIDGDSPLRVQASGEFLGNPYPCTATRALDTVVRVASLPPGLYRPDQIAPSSWPG
jgi:hypothetical protein